MQWEMRGTATAQLERCLLLPTPIVFSPLAPSITRDSLEASARPARQTMEEQNPMSLLRGFPYTSHRLQDSAHMAMRSAHRFPPRSPAALPHLFYRRDPS